MQARPHLILAVATICLSWLAPPAKAQLMLLWDVGRNFEIVNVGAEALRFDGYSIHSPPGNLEPEHWISLEESFAADSVKALATLGLHEMSPVSSTRFNLAESSMGNGATLQPGASWGIGQPFGPEATLGEICAGTTFEYTDADGVVGGGTQAGDVFCIPEPSSLLLALAGLLGCRLLPRRARYSTAFSGQKIGEAS